jgi:tetratricopeptide (TPR) repeat protein
VTPPMMHTTAGVSEYDTTIRAHAGHYCAVVGRAGPRLAGAGTPDGGRAQLRALRYLEAESANIGEGLDTASHQEDPILLLPFARWLPRYFAMRGDARRNSDVFGTLLIRAVQLADLELLFYCRIGAAMGLYRMAQYAAAQEQAEAAREVAAAPGSTLPLGMALNLLGLVQYVKGNWAASRDLIERSLDLRRQSGDLLGVAGSLINLGNHYTDNHDEAERLYLQARELSCSQGDRYGEAYAKANLAMDYRRSGKLDLALEQQSQALAMRQELGDRYGEGESLRSLAEIYLARGEYERAQELGQESLTLNRERGNREGEAPALECLARASSMLGDFDRALELAVQTRALCCSMQRPIEELQALGIQANVHYLRGEVEQALGLHRQVVAGLSQLDGDIVARRCGSWLAAPLAARGHYRTAALALAAGPGPVDTYEQHMAHAGRCLLEAAQAAGQLSSAQQAAWQSEGVALTTTELLGRLAEAVQAALNSDTQSP